MGVADAGVGPEQVRGVDVRDGRWRCREIRDDLDLVEGDPEQGAADRFANVSVVVAPVAVKDTALGSQVSSCGSGRPGVRACVSVGPT